jgi:hypothetical protein
MACCMLLLLATACIECKQPAGPAGRSAAKNLTAAAMAQQAVMIGRAPGSDGWPAHRPQPPPANAAQHLLRPAARLPLSPPRRFGTSTSMVKVAQLEVGGEQITGLVAHFGAGADSHQRQPPQPPRPLPLLRGLRAVHTSPPMAEGPLTNGAALRGAIAGTPSPAPRPAPTFRGRLVKHCGQDVLLQLQASQPAWLRACLLAQHSMHAAPRGGSCQERGGAGRDQGTACTRGGSATAGTAAAANRPLLGAAALCAAADGRGSGARRRGSCRRGRWGCCCSTATSPHGAPPATAGPTGARTAGRCDIYLVPSPTSGQDRKIMADGGAAVFDVLFQRGGVCTRVSPPCAGHRHPGGSGGRQHRAVATRRRHDHHAELRSAGVGRGRGGQAGDDSDRAMCSQPVVQALMS